jgi:hypothetical protein
LSIRTAADTLLLGIDYEVLSVKGPFGNISGKTVEWRELTAGGLAALECAMVKVGART